MLLPRSLLQARLAQSAERKALNLVVVGSSPTVGVYSTASTARQRSYLSLDTGLLKSLLQQLVFEEYKPA